MTELICLQAITWLLSVFLGVLIIYLFRARWWLVLVLMLSGSAQAQTSSYYIYQIPLLGFRFTASDYEGLVSTFKGAVTWVNGNVQTQCPLYGLAGHTYYGGSWAFQYGIFDVGVNRLFVPASGLNPNITVVPVGSEAVFGCRKCYDGVSGTKWFAAQVVYAEETIVPPWAVEKDGIPQEGGGGLTYIYNVTYDGGGVPVSYDIVYQPPEGAIVDPEGGGYINGYIDTTDPVNPVWVWNEPSEPSTDITPLVDIASSEQSAWQSWRSDNSDLSGDISGMSAAVVSAINSISAPVVNVAAPVVNVAAPVVNVAAPVVNVDTSGIEGRLDTLMNGSMSYPGGYDLSDIWSEDYDLDLDYDDLFSAWQLGIDTPITAPIEAALTMVLGKLPVIGTSDVLLDVSGNFISGPVELKIRASDWPIIPHFRAIVLLLLLIGFTLKVIEIIKFGLEV